MEWPQPRNKALWYRLASVLSALHLAAVWVAARPGEPWHATTHAGLALGFGLWAQRLRRDPGASEVQDRLDELEPEVSALRQELGEAQERLDFAERLLAQAPAMRREEPRE